MRVLVLVVGLAMLGCSEPTREEEGQLIMELLPVSYTDFGDWGPISNPSSLVVTIRVGRAKGTLFHVRDGEISELGDFEFDANDQTFLCSTPFLRGEESESQVDVSFIWHRFPRDEPSARSVKVFLGEVAMVSRTDQQNSILEGVNVLYRIQRTKEEDARQWRLQHEESREAMAEASKDMDVEYIALEVEQVPIEAR